MEKIRRILSSFFFPEKNRLSTVPFPLRAFSLCAEDDSQNVGADLSSRAVAGKVFSALRSLTSVFGMGTGGPSGIWHRLSETTVPEN